MPRRLTADKREIKDFPKLPSATSFIRRTLCDMLGELERWVPPSWRHNLAGNFWNGQHINSVNSSRI